jgi:glycosyltransferase involved in cell wall biosynthesis
MMTDNGTIGALWKAGDTGSFQKALEALLMKEYDQESETAASYFKKELSFEAIAGKYVKMTESILSRQK